MTTSMLTPPPTSTPTPVARDPQQTSSPEPPSRRRVAGLVRGPADQPSWSRPAFLGLLVATAMLYVWDLSASGYANSFYAAATQAGSHSWKAWFFGSLDSGNSITVDKPPAALWIDGLSARIFGFNSWSLLAPQALEGVAAVGLLYATVRRISGPVAGLIAGAVLALTPAAVLMFRFNNPDALLTLLLVAAAYAVTRALAAASSRWLMLAGTALGFAFLTKMLQGFLVLPAFAIVYLVAAPTSLRRRIGHTLLAGGAVLISAGWWVAVVAAWPASARPYIGGSTNNSVLNLVFGYNGLGRLFGSTQGGGGGGTAGSSFGGATGLTRLFSSEMGNEISWLLPASLVALVTGLWATRRAPRTDGTRAALLLWGGWLVVTGLVFSYMKGVIHPYYTVALAPAVAALVAIGGARLWQERGTSTGRLGLAAIIGAAGGWSYVLLGRVSWHPELRWLIVAVTVIAAVGLTLPVRRLGRGAALVAVSGILVGLLGTGAFAAATAATPHTGSIPDVGPAIAQTGGMGGGGGGNAPGTTTGGRPTAPGTSTGGRPTAPSGTTGGIGAGSTSSAALTTALEATTTQWAAATVGDQSAAELELASGKAVIAIGGWSGSDASPTLAQFKAYVAERKIHYFISGNAQGGGGSGQSGVGSQITAWVTASFTATTIGGQTVYDLTASTG